APVARGEAFFVFRNQPRPFGGGGDGALDGDSFSAVSFDVGDNAVRVLLAGRIVHHPRGACRTQALGDSRADPLRRTGHDRHLTFQIAHVTPPSPSSII